MGIPDAAFMAHYGKTQTQLLDEIFENVRKSLLEVHVMATASYGMFPEFDAIIDDFEAQVKAAKRGSAPAE